MIDMVKREIRLDGFELSELDEFVLDFVRILEKYTEYAVVSGYLAILFGNVRPTLDVDVLYRGFSKQGFSRFIDEIFKKGYSIVPSDKDEILDILENKGEKVDIFHKDSAWYFDFKKAKGMTGKTMMSSRDRVVINGKDKMDISAIEFQIPYKLSMLGADKDIKDAAFLYEKFLSDIDEKKLKEFSELLNADLSLLGDNTEVD